MSTHDAARGGSATVRIGPMLRLPEILRELGFDPSEVLAGTGFDPGLFIDADLPVPYRSVTRMLGHCAAVTGCSHLGLLLATRAGAGSLGLPGLLLLSAGDVRTGLQALSRYMDLHDRGAVVTLQCDGDAAVLGYAIVGEVDGSDLAYDIAMTVAFNLMRALVGDGWSPTEVLLKRARPADEMPWRHCFHAPVRFGAELCGLRFPAKWLAVSPPAANPSLHEYLRKDADRMQSLLGKSLVDEVRRIVQGSLSSPPCNAARVAQLLGMHERTLNRRLLANGTNFRRLRDEVLHGMSRQLLGNTSMRVADVATALGYSEASAFIRAFARWSGRSPSDWRHDTRQSR
jgi:AraC-like DNA-binding protein